MVSQMHTANYFSVKIGNGIGKLSGQDTRFTIKDGKRGDALVAWSSFNFYFR